MTETAIPPPSTLRAFRYFIVFYTLAMLLLWVIVIEPKIAHALHYWPDADHVLVVRGFLVAVLALAFTLARRWTAYGFRGGLQLWWWRAFWPIWALALPLFALTAASRSPRDHLLWLVISFFVGFSEEAICRGVILRELLPGGARSAILWSSFWFAALHLLGLVDGLDPRMVLLTVAGAFAFGVITAWVRMAAASIWPCVIAHAFFDYSIFVYSGGILEAMEYSTDQLVISGVELLLLLPWALWLLRLPATRGLAKPTRPGDVGAPGIV